MFKQTEEYLKKNREIKKYTKIIESKRTPHKIYHPSFKVVKDDLLYSLKCLFKYPLELLVGRKYWKNLKKLKYRGRGKKILVLGNGPSQGYLSADYVNKFLSNGNAVMVINHLYHNEIFC